MSGKNSDSFQLGLQSADRFVRTATGIKMLVNEALFFTRFLPSDHVTKKSY